MKGEKKHWKCRLVQHEVEILTFKCFIAGGHKSKKMKLTVKGGAAVDPDSGLENSAHVLEQSGKMYSATLGLVDIVRGTNSYYKLQLLEDDVQKRLEEHMKFRCNKKKMLDV